MAREESRTRSALVATNNGALTILAYYGPGEVVTIPSTVNDLTVTAIWDGAFDAIISLDH